MVGREGWGVGCALGRDGAASMWAREAQAGVVRSSSSGWQDLLVGQTIWGCEGGQGRVRGVLPV